MDALAAFAAATQWTHEYATYDRGMLNAQQALGFDPFPWETEAEFLARKKGECRDYAAEGCRQTWQRRPGCDVRIVRGFAPGQNPQGHEGHAWCELHDGETVVWSDPTFGTLPASRESFEAKGYVPVCAYRYDGIGWPEQFPYTKETA